MLSLGHNGAHAPEERPVLVHNERLAPTVTRDLCAARGAYEGGVGLNEMVLEIDVRSKGEPRDKER